LSDLAHLKLMAESSFALDSYGRMLRQNDPDHTKAPRLLLKGCAEGNVVYFRNDVSAETAATIERLVLSERPLCTRDSEPAHLARYLALLEADAASVEFELAYELPTRKTHSSHENVVRSGTAEGDALLSEYALDGVPPGLLDLGFKDTGEFWAPWCVVFDDDEPAAIAFAARLGARGAATGVATVKAFRGRGHAAAAVAAWSAHHDLARKTLGYSHNRENASSQRVTERLGLRFIGVQLSIA
jgi:hypothetical protein